MATKKKKRQWGSAADVKKYIREGIGPKKTSKQNRTAAGKAAGQRAKKRQGKGAY